MPRKYKKKHSYKKYSKNYFQLAIESVSAGYSIRESAIRYGVPYSTLNLHINNEVSHDRVGRPTKFSQEEEDHLEKAALILQSWGVPLTIDEFLKLSKQYALSLNKIHLFSSGTPTYDWLYSFLNRHNNLILKKSYPLEKKRAALTCEQVDNWFQLLNKIIQENDLADRPAQIFNSDESGMSDNISYSKVIVHRYTSNAYRIQGGTGGRSYISVMFCGSATGLLLPPFVIYKSKRLLDEWCIGGPTDIGYDCSEKFLKDEYTRTNFRSITKAQFPSLLKQVWTSDPVGAKTNVVKSFMKAGIFPFNPNSIDRSRILKNNTNVDKNITNTSINLPNDNQTSTFDSPSSPQPITSPFASSHQAIAALDQILEETKLNTSYIEDLNDHVDNDDDDDEYLPSNSNLASSISTSSNQQNKIIASTSHQSVLSTQKKKRKRKFSTIIGFDTSEEDDDENLSSPTSKSQQLQKKYELQPRKTLSSKHDQTISPEEQKKRMKLALKTVGFDTSDEEDTVSNSLTPNSQNSIQAITNAIQTVFGTQSNKTSKQPSKRTVINRSNGQIITEKIVIEQLEERKNKRNTKRSSSNNRTTSAPKRQKKANNSMIDQSIIFGTNSTIAIHPTSPLIGTTQSSISFD
ncbi:unnamed protein product [Rotaria sp. Silwood2]|nr:unnamed protein product [Rotaria sp. Silwood2]